MIPSTRARSRHRIRLLAAAAVGFVALGTTAACGGAADLPPDPQVGTSSAAPAPEPVQALPKARPTGMRIDTAGIDAKKMVDLKLDATGELGVPDPDTDADSLGWWPESVTPGEVGISVLVAHFDTKHGPALMKDVGKIKAADVIEVPREDGTTAKFRIREVQGVPKKDFPTEKVYSSTDHAELRLLTCGGGIEDGHRTDNIIIYADLVV
ncbi:sortase [Kitasatospora sp. NPDC093806]|uniref:sortase domain-containing protein n=1 Tax=Kitasatospora sp. NPDC093806 TaxID=3155075 RepID=UPI00343BBA58